MTSVVNVPDHPLKGELDQDVPGAGARFGYGPDIERFLLDTPWVRRVRPSHRELIMSSAFCSKHPHGGLVARRGEASISWMGVAQGLLKASGGSGMGDSVLFTGIPAGAWVGEGSVIKRECRKYDVIAMRRSTVVHIPSATFHVLLESSIEFSRFIIDHLNARLGQYMSMVEDYRIRDPEVRVARGIASLFDSTLYPTVGPVVPLSQTDIGELIGLSRQRTNSAIKHLQRLGLLTPEHGAVRVHDLSKLRAYADHGD